MGNKRKLLKYIEEEILKLPHNTIGEGFSGSGIVSRLFKTHCKKLYVNDIAGYSQTLNHCYLSTLSEKELKILQKYIDKANEFVDSGEAVIPWISEHWGPPKRLYYTQENAKRIDAYRFYIQSLPKNIQPYLLAVLLVEASIHTNTSGQFSAYYKNGWGGKTKTDVKRITQKIVLKMPILNDNKCYVNISKKDVNEWIKEIPEVDIMYYDPPYNKHPYNIYYFLLDIINDWDLNITIPDTYRGQPKTWVQSKYNSFNKAYNVFENLIKNTKAKYILISYNNGGIIPPQDLENMLKKYGELEIKNITHKTYNRLKGIAKYKKEKEKEKIKEVLYILKKI